MDRDKVIEIFNDLLWGSRKEIAFSKGYKEFEEQYELNKEYLERVDNGLISVVYRKNENEKQIKNRKE
jgi:hypothetical protein